MKIYRLETANGRGVYTGGLINTLTEDYNSGVPRHPAPWRDSKFNLSHKERFGTEASNQDFSDKFVFGFSCPKQLLRWFYNREDLQTLETSGGVQVSVYECDDVIEGNTQIAFAVWHHQLFIPAAVYRPTEFYDMFSAEADSPIGSRSS